jgi:metal-sulfur cluster biosynthetic enzyme
MTPTTEQVLNKIGSIPEPCALLMHDQLSIREMGLIDSVHIDDGRVRVELVLTDTSCVHLASMSRYIVDSVGELDGVVDVQVIPSATKLWTPDRLQRHVDHSSKPPL